MKRPKPIQGIKGKLPFKRRPIIDEVVRETTSGGIVFRIDPKTKGHVEPGEDPRDTARREINEETGLKEMKVHSWLGKVNFRYRRSHTLVLMTMHIYLVEGKGETDKLNPEDWLNDIKWLPATEAVDKIAYDDIGKLILVCMQKIRKGEL
jgi:ADP-ribose pyrophosphatase YjhB (NUDIX family)